MPFVVRSDSENENEAELVFLSPDEEVGPRQRASAKEDQGASPVLRRSNRKRKSVVRGDTDMSRGSGSKKKKGSPSKTPDKDKDMTARTPKAGPSQPPNNGAPKTAEKGEAPSIQDLLLGMEGRLSSKLDVTDKKVEKALTLATETNSALEDLELKVAASEAAVANKLETLQKEVMEEVNTKVKTIVLDQLRSVGFDPDLTAADMSTRLSAM